MSRNKRSFFERLTGSVDIEDSFDDVDFGEEEAHSLPIHNRTSSENGEEALPEEESGDGQLAVDVYQKPDEIVIKAVTAGVKPDDLDVSITRDMVTIRGRREEAREVEGDDYFYQELYWGSFSRTILLPQEIETEEAEATEKNGLLIIRLPKIDKEKQTKLKVRGN